MANVYFELTREFNQNGLISVLASGQAVVFHQLAIMSKDGDWILREDEAASVRVLAVLESHGARMRPGAPLHPRWLAGGWSSHFEFQDERRRRIRCDFVSRPPRIADVGAVFRGAVGEGGLRVVDVETLIRLKQTQRGKDWPVIAELARRLPPELELSLTVDLDRILALAPAHPNCHRRSVEAVASGRDAALVALAREVDAMQQADRLRLQRYTTAAGSYLAAFARERLGDQPLSEAHRAACALAETLLPVEP